MWNDTFGRSSVSCLEHPSFLSITGRKEGLLVLTWTCIRWETQNIICTWTGGHWCSWGSLGCHVWQMSCVRSHHDGVDYTFMKLFFISACGPLVGRNAPITLCSLVLWATIRKQQPLCNDFLQNMLGWVAFCRNGFSGTRALHAPWDQESIPNIGLWDCSRFNWED